MESPSLHAQHLNTIFSDTAEEFVQFDNTLALTYPEAETSDAQPVEDNSLFLRPEDEEECLAIIDPANSCTGTRNSSINNGGSTDYYKFDPLWTDLQDIIEAHSLNFAQGNILKAAFTFNVGRHNSTNYERELNKIAWFVQRELNRLNKKGNT